MMFIRCEKVLKNTILKKKDFKRLRSRGFPMRRRSFKKGEQLREPQTRVKKFILVR